MAAGLFEQAFDDSSLMGSVNGGGGMDMALGDIVGGSSSSDEGSRCNLRPKAAIDTISFKRCGTDTDISRSNTSSLTASGKSSLSGTAQGNNKSSTALMENGDRPMPSKGDVRTGTGALGEAVATSTSAQGIIGNEITRDEEFRFPWGMGLEAFTSTNGGIQSPLGGSGSRTHRLSSPVGAPPPPLPQDCASQSQGGGGGGVSPHKSGTNPGYRVLKWEELSNLTYMTKGAMCEIYSADLGGTKVAVKIPRLDCEDPDVAAHDLEVELDVLKRVEHKHIIALIGAGLRKEAPQRFLVLEFLELGTLAEKLEDETATGDRKDSTFMRRQKRTRRYQHFYMVTMLERSLELALALEHLHYQAPDTFIVHRDLKPDNVGFKADGTLKLFDFGLARVVKRRNRVNARYEMTGETGSMRYMAPEVVESLPYNEKVDVYAFGLLLWEMLEYRRVFDGMGVSDFYQRVVNGGARPPLDPSWPQDLRKLITQCWHADVDRRPNFKVITERLSALYNGEKHSSKLCLSALNVTEDETGRLHGGSTKALVRSATTTQIVGGARGDRRQGSSTQAGVSRKTTGGRSSGLLRTFGKTVGRIFSVKKGGAEATLTHTAPETYSRTRPASINRSATSPGAVGSGSGQIVVQGGDGDERGIEVEAIFEKEYEVELEGDG